MRGSNPNSSYGVSVAASNPYLWNGWAWGGEVLGWLSFSGSGTGGGGAGGGGGGGGGYGVVGPASGGPTGAPPFVVAVAASPNPAEVQKLVTWSALVSGGEPPYTYAWSGTDGLSGTSATAGKTYATVGTKTGTVTVRDSRGAVRTESLEINVVPKRRIGGIEEIQPE